MLKALLLTFIVGAIVFLLSGFSIHSYSLRQEVKRLLRTDFNDELVLTKAQTEHKAGTRRLVPTTFISTIKLRSIN